MVETETSHKPELPSSYSKSPRNYHYIGTEDRYDLALPTL